MALVYLITGSNMGNRSKILAEASKMIQERVGEVINRSFIYESAAWGFSHPNKFLNQVLKLETSYNPEELLNQLQEIEKSLGRKRAKTGYHARNIDIDILFYDDHVISSERLNIPHKRIQERNFVLVPLSELQPDLIHPVLHKTIRELLRLCDDNSEVTVFSKK